jgi:hypothetical protein
MAETKAFNIEIARNVLCKDDEILIKIPKIQPEYRIMVEFTCRRVGY